MKKLIYIAILLLTAVSVFSKERTFADKYLELRKITSEDKIQIHTISGKKLIEGIKDSIHLSKISGIEKKQIMSLMDKVDKAIILVDSDKPTGDDSEGKALKKLLNDQEEYFSFDMGGFMNIKLLSDGGSSINDFTIFFEIGNQMNLFGDIPGGDVASNNSSKISLNIGNNPIVIEGENVCAVVNITFNKPVSEDEILALIKNAKFHSPEESVTNKDELTSNEGFKEIFSINHKGKILYFKGIESSIIDSINMDANHFFSKSIEGTMIIAPTDGSKYSGDIEIPSFVEYKGKQSPVVCIDANAFNKANITSVSIPEGVLSIEHHAFEDCMNLKSIVIPNSVKSILTAAFQGCKNLETVKLSNSLQYLAGFSFNGCESLTSIILPESLKMIGEYAFAVCGFKEFQFNPVKNITNGILSNCKQLETLIIPASVVSIHRDCLFNNPGLKTIMIESEEPPFIDKIFFWKEDQVNVKVPAASMDKYKSTPFWKDMNLTAIM
ncbi:MAG: leucine-rich repeat domain-containing protein [Bacteroidales bacterium]|nr:leucine-rich repeat domain-containing protein [Bacteroidales bacterium]